jgi:hypothetical protein
MDRRGCIVVMIAIAMFCLLMFFNGMFMHGDLITSPP